MNCQNCNHYIKDGILDKQRGIECPNCGTKHKLNTSTWRWEIVRSQQLYQIDTIKGTKGTNGKDSNGKNI